MTKEHIGIDFDNLPKTIKDWLSSSRLTLLIIDLNKRLNITGPKQFIISILVEKLITGAIEPQDFVSALADELDLSQSAAKALTKEIERIALHPIEQNLKDELGVDTALLHLEQETDLPSLSNIGPISERVAVRPSFASPKYLPEETERHIETPRPSSIIEPPKGPAAPFILHEERETVKPIASAPRQTFSIRIPLREKKYAPIVPPVAARIETGEMENLKTRELENKKEINNYNNVRFLPAGRQGHAKGLAMTETEGKKEEMEMRLPRPPMGALSARPRSIEMQENKKESPTLILPLRKGEEMGREEGGDFRIRLKPISGEPKRPEPNPLVAKVVNYTQRFTPLE